MNYSTSADKNSVLQIHATTLPHLDLIEKIILDELIRQGRAVVVPDTGVTTV
jgi:hypothetical protein